MAVTRPGCALLAIALVLDRACLDGDNTSQPAFSLNWQCRTAA